MRIRNGKNIKSKLSDYSSKSILEDSKLKSFLRTKKFNSALLFLLENLNEKLNSNGFSEFFVLVVISVLFIYYAATAAYSCCCARKRKSIKEKLEKIKHLTEAKKDKKQFVEDNCVICLEEFSEKELQKKQSENNKNDKKI